MWLSRANAWLRNALRAWDRFRVRGEWLPGPSVAEWGPLVTLALLVPVVIALASLKLGEIHIAAAVGGIIALALILGEPFVGLLLFVAILYIRPEETWPALKGLRLALGVSVLTLVGMSYQFLQRRLPLTRTPFLGTLGGFVLWVVVSTIPNGNTSEAAQDIFKLFLLAFLVLNLVRTPERYAWFSGSILVLSGYLAAYSLYLCSTGQAIFDEGTVRSQATGIFGDPNDLSAAIIAGVALAAIRLPRTRGVIRLANLAYCLLCLAAIQQTNSRGGMMATLAVMGVAMLASVKRKGPAIAMALVVGSLVLALGPSRMRNFDTSESSANSRFWFWDNGVNLMLASPLIGVGYGQFPAQNGGMTAHNSFVLCFAELGFPGYLFWIGGLYFCYRRQPPAEQPADPVARQELLGARLALTGFLVAAFWLSRTYTPVLYVLMCLPGTAQLAARGETSLFEYGPNEKWADWLRIAAISACSIALIKVIATTQK